MVVVFFLANCSLADETGVLTCFSLTVVDLDLAAPDGVTPNILEIIEPKAKAVMKYQVEKGTFEKKCPLYSSSPNQGLLPIHGKFPILKGNQA